MSFLSPWAALAVAAVVVPLLVLLYFLKLRRREAPVSSTLLWRRAVQDLQVNAPFQRLRRNLLLLLQLLVLAAGVLALARPVVQTSLSDEKRLVIVIDHSASMNAVEADGRTRLDHARTQARRLVRALNRTGSAWWRILSGVEPQTRVMLIAMAERAEVLSPFTANTSDLVRLIDAIEPTDAPTNVSEALSLAGAYLTRTRRDERPGPGQASGSLVLISDGAYEPPADISVRTRRVVLIPVGKATDNVAITSLRFRRNYERPEQVNVLVQVENFGSKTVSSDVSIYVDGVLRHVETVRLGPARKARTPPTATQRETEVASPVAGGAPPTVALSIALTLPDQAVIEARLAREDALACDNRASTIVPPPRRLSVLVVTKGNFFLERVLRALPLESRLFVTPQQYENAPEGAYARDGASRFDVVIFDGHDSQRLPTGNYLFFGGLPKVAGIEDAGLAEKFPILWWDEAHPVLRDVALEYVFVARGRRLRLPKEAEVLAEAAHGPVIAHYGARGRQYLLVSFTVQDSTWWNKVSFPIFLYNAIAYLGGAGTGEQDPTLRPGQTLAVPVPPSTAQVTIVRPDGRRDTIRVDADHVARYGDTSRVGVYTVERPGAPPLRVAVNLADPAESRITPRMPERLGGARVETEAGIQNEMPEVWRWAVLAALALLLLEWYIYTRRVMI